jgi:Transglutaminase-like superfamily
VSPGVKARLALEIVLTYVRVRRLLRRMPVTDALAVLRDEQRPAKQATSQLPSAARLGGIVQRVLRRVPGDTRCLTQSLVLATLLARRGVAASVVIAVSPGERFGAHAWVAHEGRPLLPVGDASFRPIVQL